MFRYVDVFISILIVAIVLLMIIPIPTSLLDFLQLFNISLAVLLLLTTMYIRNALELSSFPTLLLILTLFRLALNVTSTRLILLQGKNFGGKVIRTFGQFVVGGDYIVGLIIFLILVIIQFIVITRGAERIAEVAARFTLDAMPGKQMSIDADLSAGLITEDEAREKRAEIRREADFYGAMDGASKFVRGDAIASIVITFVNIVGGLLIGILRHGMSAGEAAEVYTLLTVGDGLVAQIPALLISTAAGIIVSRAASQENLGKDITRELTRETRVVLLTGGTILFLGLFTPIPAVPALMLGTILLILGYFSMRRVPVPTPAGPPGAPGAPPGPPEEHPPSRQPPLTTPDEVASVIQSDTVEVDIGYGLIPLADPSQGGDLLDRVTMVRKQLAYELGIVLTPIRMRDSVLLKANEYVIKLRGTEVGRYELFPNRLLAINPGAAEEPLPGIKTKEPSFGLNAYWIDESLKEEAMNKGYTVVDAPSVFATHLAETIRSHAHEVLGTREFNLLIDGLKQTHEELVDEVIPNLLKPHEVRRILQNLLRERVSIRNLPLIFEVLSENAERIQQLDLLTEKVRRALSRQIAQNLRGDDGKIHAVALDPQLERMILDSLREGEEEKVIAMNPEMLREFINKLGKALESLMRKGHLPVVVTSGSIRFYVSKLINRYIPNVSVIAYEEVPDDIPLQVEEVVKL
ncbi:MAG: flagellar biosynthesis protein FlhA [Thermotogae bacterium]|nr:flagellar biosynthesis protein FlhA [Thermotogota bacterium]